jgi:hypothetical protein
VYDASRERKGLGSLQNALKTPHDVLPEPAVYATVTDRTLHWIEVAIGLALKFAHATSTPGEASLPLVERVGEWTVYIPKHQGRKWGRQVGPPL